MQQFKFKSGTRVKHESFAGAGEVIEQVNTDITKVEWYTKDRGFFITLFLTDKLTAVERDLNDVDFISKDSLLKLAGLKE